MNHSWSESARVPTPRCMKTGKPPNQPTNQPSYQSTDNPTTKTSSLILTLFFDNFNRFLQISRLQIRFNLISRPLKIFQNYSHKFLIFCFDIFSDYNNNEITSNHPSALSDSWLSYTFFKMTTTSSR